MECRFYLQTDLPIDDVVHRLRSAEKGIRVPEGKWSRTIYYVGTLNRTSFNLMEPRGRYHSIEVRGKMHETESGTVLVVDGDVWGDAVSRWAKIAIIVWLFLVVMVSGSIIKSDWIGLTVWVLSLAGGLSVLIARRIWVYPRLLKREIAKMAKIIDAHFIEELAEAPFKTSIQ